MNSTRRSGRHTLGYFGIVVWQPKSENNIGTLWRSALLQDAAFIGTIGRRYQKQASDTPNTGNHVPLVNYVDIDDMIAHLPNSCKLVAIELDQHAKPLPRYTHPLRAVYLLGAEDHGIPEAVIEKCHDVVQIPTMRPWSMNVAVAGSIVMYDRIVKASSA